MLFRSQTLGEGEWAVSFSAGVDFFGIGTLDADGWFNSKGHFAMRLSGKLTIGVPSILAIEGEFSIYVYSLGPVGAALAGTSGGIGFGGSATVDLKIIGHTLAGVAVEFDYDPDTGIISLTAQATFSILFVDVKVEHTYTIGTLQLGVPEPSLAGTEDRKSTRLNSSH